MGHRDFRDPKNSFGPFSNAEVIMVTCAPLSGHRQHWQDEVILTMGSHRPPYQLLIWLLFIILTAHQSPQPNLLPQNPVSFLTHLLHSYPPSLPPRPFRSPLTKSIILAFEIHVARGIASPRPPPPPMLLQYKPSLQRNASDRPHLVRNAPEQKCHPTQIRRAMLGDTQGVVFLLSSGSVPNLGARPSLSLRRSLPPLHGRANSTDCHSHLTQERRAAFGDYPSQYCSCSSDQLSNRSLCEPGDSKAATPRTADPSTKETASSAARHLSLSFSDKVF
jgi:hypothetical protein